MDDKTESPELEAEREAEKSRREDQAVRLSRFLFFFSFLATLAIIGLLVAVQLNNRNLENVQTSVTHLEEFVNDLEEEDPQEEQQNQAITVAVQTVPRLEDILCEAFPEATACQTQEAP